MIPKINRFSRFSNEETSVLHNEMRYTTKFSPINWRYSIKPYGAHLCHTYSLLPISTTIRNKNIYFITVARKQDKSYCLP